MLSFSLFVQRPPIYHFPALLNRVLNIDSNLWTDTQAKKTTCVLLPQESSGRIPKDVKLSAHRDPRKNTKGHNTKNTGTKSAHSNSYLNPGRKKLLFLIKRPIQSTPVDLLSLPFFPLSSSLFIGWPLAFLEDAADGCQGPESARLIR